jgi:hypothetical protein
VIIMNDNNNSNDNNSTQQDLQLIDESDLSEANGGRRRAAVGLARQAYRWATSGEGRKYFRRGAAAGAGFETGRRAIRHMGGGEE